MLCLLLAILLMAIGELRMVAVLVVIGIRWGSGSGSVVIAVTRPKGRAIMRLRLMMVLLLCHVVLRLWLGMVVRCIVVLRQLLLIVLWLLRWSISAVARLIVWRFHRDFLGSTIDKHWL